MSRKFGWRLASLRRSKIFRMSEAEQHSAEKNGLVQFN
jgi:hypothetical protein